MHTVIDDHSRLAYAESTTTRWPPPRPRPDPAVAWFAQRDVVAQRVLSDNGTRLPLEAVAQTCAQLGIKPSRTRPYRPQTNGKIERFHRTMSDGWGNARCYTSEAERRSALSAWLHEYNHHRPHTALREQATHHPLDQPPGQYS